MSLIQSIGTIINREQRAHRNPAIALADKLNGVRDVERATQGGLCPRHLPDRGKNRLCKELQALLVEQQSDV